MPSGEVFVNFKGNCIGDTWPGLFREMLSEMLQAFDRSWRTPFNLHGLLDGFNFESLSVATVVNELRDIKNYLSYARALWGQRMLKDFSLVSSSETSWSICFKEIVRFKENGCNRLSTNNSYLYLRIGKICTDVTRIRYDFETTFQRFCTNEK